MNIYKVGDIHLALSQKQVENLINKRDNYDIREREIVQELANGNVLDIGANIGYLTCVMASSDKVKHVYAFEPDNENYINLCINLRLNALSNKVECFNRAVTNNNGYTKLYKCNINDGMHRIYQSKWCSNAYENVETNKIDGFQHITKNKIDFVKLDVEGSEYGALKGMEQMLKRDHPTIMMEFHPPSIEEAGDNPKDIYDFLIANDYEINIMDSDIYLMYEDLVRFTKYNPAVNLVCK